MARNPYATWSKQPRKTFVIVTGVEELDKKLAEFEPKLQKKWLRQAMRDGLKLVLAEAQDNCPVLSGLTKDNIKIRAGKRSRSKITMFVRVGPSDDLVKTTLDGKRYFTPACVEYGHKGRPATVSGIEYGTTEVVAHPFMRPAYDSTAEDARDTTMAALLEAAMKEAES